MNRKTIIPGLIICFIIILGTRISVGDDIIKLVVNGEDITSKFEYKPVIINGRTYVPARALAESLGASVTWDSETRTVIVATNKSEKPEPVANTEISNNPSDKANGTMQGYIGDISYYGEWVDGVPNPRGNCVYTFPDGRKLFDYQGVHDGGLPSSVGKGVFDGFEYEGVWKNGMPNGEGKAKYKNKKDKTIIYEGDWENGLPNGEGIYRLGNGPILYKGEVKNNQYHGWGTGYTAKGIVYHTGYWRDGIPQK